MWRVSGGHRHQHLDALTLFCNLGRACASHSLFPLPPPLLLPAGLSEWVVRSPAEIYGLMERGGATRATASTRMNEISSRSHAVFIVIVEQSETTYLDEAGAEMTAEEFHR